MRDAVRLSPADRCSPAVIPLAMIAATLLAAVLGGVARAEEFLVRPGGFAVPPAAGEIQAQDEFLLPGAEEMIESIWQGGALYRREVPVADGRPDRAHAGEWQDATPSPLPGQGEVRSYDLYRRPDGTAVEETLWRGDEGFGRSVPVSGGVIGWQNAGAWSAPIPVAALPGDGDVRSADNHLSPDGGALLQSFWRGELGWGRSVPVTGGEIRWGQAGDWSEPLKPDQVPGNGAAESQSSFLLPGSFEQVYWRGGEEFRRRLPVASGAIDWGAGAAFARAGAATSAALSPAAFDEGDGGFGFALDLDGDLLAVATAADPGEVPTCPGDPHCVAGAVEIFARGPAGGFTRVARFAGTQGDSFGYDVAVAGGLVAVGVPGAEELRGAVEIYGPAGGGFELLARLAVPAGGSFGVSLAFDGQTLAAGAINSHDDRGRAYVFRRHHGGIDAWGQVAEIVPEPGFGHFFGVVALAGDTLAVGSWSGEQVAIHRRHRGGSDRWGRAALLAGPAGESFGRRLALAGDTLLVGAPSATVDGQAAAGAAYVYRRDADDRWRQAARLVAEDPASLAELGGAVALGDGLAAVGGAGVTYLFGEEPRTGEWRQVRQHAGTPSFGRALALDGRTLAASAYADWIGEVRGGVTLLEVPPPSPAESWHAIELAGDPAAASFGAAVARVGDAVAVGVPGACDEDSGVADCPPGRVEIYERGTAGEEAGELGAWRSLSAPAPVPGDGFGAVLAATSDLLAVGAPGRSPSIGKPGGVYLFGRDAGGFRRWQPVATFGGAETGVAGGFGAALALTGERLLIGAPDGGAPEGGAGEVRVVEHPADGEWKQVAVLTASDGLPGDGFGGAVAQAGDLAAIGAPGDDLPGVAGVTDAGAVYLFTAGAGGWSETGRLAAGIPADGARFGAAIALDGDLLAVGAPGEGAAVGEVHLFARDAGGVYQPATVLSGDDLEVEAGFGATLDAEGGLLLVGARIGPTLLLARHPEGPSRWIEVGRLPGAVKPPSETGSSGAAVDLAASAAALGLPASPAGAATVYEPSWEAPRRPRIELLPERSVVLGAPGDAFTFEPRLLWPRTPDAFHPGGWTATPPAGFDDEATIAWSSSDPSQVTVSDDGTATAVRVDAYGVIQARLRASDETGGTAAALPEHDPGQGAVMIAVLNPALVRLSDGLVSSHEVIVGDRMADVEVRLEVRATPATEALRAGQKVLFGDDWGLLVAAVEPAAAGRLTVRGRPLSLEEIFEELHVDFEWPPPGLQARVGGAGGGASAGDSGVDLECGISFTWQTEVGSLKFEPDVVGGALTGLVIFGELLTTFGLDPATAPVSQDQELACTLEMPDVFLATVPVPAFPALGVKVDFATAFNLKAILNFDPGVVLQTKTPELDVTQTTGAGFSWSTGDTGLQAIEGPDPSPQVDFEPNLTSTEEPPRALEIVLTGTLTMEVGGKWNLTLGPPDDVASVAEIYGPVLEFGPAREYRLPFSAFLTVFSDQYVGPAITDRLEATIHPIKTLGLNEDSALVRMLELLGVDTDQLYIELPGFPTLSIDAPYPVPSRPEPTFETVWIDGAASGLPESTGVLSTLSEWKGDFLYEPIDTCYVWAWHEDSSPASARSVASDSLAGSFTPEPGDEGTWFTRAHCAYRPFASGLGLAAPLLPAVSPLGVFEVRPAARLRLLPESTGERLGLGESVTVEVEVVNPTSEDVPYTVAANPSGSWIALSPSGTAPAGGSDPVDVILTCGETPGEYSTALELTASGGGETVGAEVALTCTFFDVIPDKRRVRADRGELWQTYFRVESLGDVPLTWAATAPAGVTVFPDTGTAGQGSTWEPAVFGDCQPAGTTEHAIVFTATATLPGGEVTTEETVTVVVGCRDDGDGDGDGDGGSSSGEPHLRTYDEVAYDFQAPGEFVFSRDAARGFEVQVRQKSIADGTVAVNRAVALGVGAGSARNRVALYVDPPAGGGTLMVDGAVLDLASGAQHDLVPSGGKIWNRGEGRWLVEWPVATNGAWVEVRRLTARGAAAWNLFVRPPDGAAPEGLLGDFDGDPGNDFALRDGTPLSSPPTHAELYDCISGVRCFAYDPAGGWWIQTASESLFDYEPGGGPWQFNPPQPWQPFEPRGLGDFDPNLVDWARQQCLAAGIGEHQGWLLDGCALDILLTGDVDFATAAADYAEPPPAPTAWVGRGELTQPPPTGNSFGRVVGVGGDEIYVGGRTSTLSGAVYVFEPGAEPGTWVEGDPVPPAVWSGGFGSVMAASPDRLVTGYTSSGHEAAWVHEHDGSGWQTTELAGEHYTAFGTSTALSGDVAAVGAIYGSSSKGHVRLYERDGGGWSPIQTVTGDDSVAGDQLGASVALADGFLAAGAPYHDPGGEISGGAVYVFQREVDGQGNVTWSQRAKLLAETPAADETAGIRLASSGDLLAIAQDPELQTVEIFRRGDAAGTVWNREAELGSSVPAGSAFGTDLAFSGDTLFVGAPLEDGDGTDRGAVYVFRPDGAGGWSEDDRMVPEQPADNQQFGHRLAAGATRLLVGAWNGEAYGSAGSVFVYELE